MTFGELWQLIERNRVSPDLRIAYFSGRFGLPERRGTIFDGEEVVINVPIGDIPIDKSIFHWDERYTGTNMLRDAAPPAGTILKILKDKGLIKTNKVIDRLIEKARNVQKVEVYNEASECLVEARSREELEHKLHILTQRSHGLIPT